MLMNRFETFSNEDLLLEYKKTGNNAMKQELVLRYRYLVKSIALQMRGVYLSFAEVDDMINEGVIALMGAIENFDPTKKAKLETYASLRIRGTIVDLARKQDWIPRSIRRKAKEIDNATLELYEKLGRMPEETEVAEYLKMPMEKYYKVIADMSLYNVVSLDSMINELQDSFTAEPVARNSETEGLPSETLQQRELSETLVSAIEGLNEREKLILSLYYRKELSMKEIARVLQVSEPRVSQLHAMAIKKLRTVMQAYVSA